MKYTLPVILFLAAPAWAAPPKLEIPSEVKPVGGYATMEPQTDAVSVWYVGLDGEEPVPSSVLANPKVFLFPTRGLPAGTRYRFAAVAAGATGEQTRADFAVVIGEAPPPPPPPPPPPGPADPLYTTLAPIYGADQTPNKAALTRALAGVYRLTATEYVGRLEYKTFGELSAVMAKAAQTVAPLPALQPLREAIARELTAKLGASPATLLTPELRAKCAEQFLRVANVLEALTK